MCSCIVYSHYEAFIEDDDDVVSAVAQVQLVLVYFAALAIYAADGQDEKNAFFSGAAFGVVLLLIFFASFVVATYVTLLETFGYENLRSVYASLCKWKSRSVPNAATGQSGGSAAVREIPSDPHDDDTSASEDSDDTVSDDAPRSDTSAAAAVRDDNHDVDEVELFVTESDIESLVMISCLRRFPQWPNADRRDPSDDG